MEKVLKCKDFDSWVSFLSRLGNISSTYILKNDIYLAFGKKTIDGKCIPGRHIVKDPLFEDDDDYVRDGIYVLYNTIEHWVQLFKNFDKDMRKKIIYEKHTDGIYIRCGVDRVSRFKVFELLTSKSDIDDNVSNEIRLSVQNIEWFDSMLEDSDWFNFQNDQLVDIRNNGIMGIYQYFGERKVETRVARSLFMLAGVSRMNTPIANYASFSFTEPNEVNIGTVRFHANYKCGSSNLISMECFHEYILLAYNVEDEEE